MSTVSIGIAEKLLEHGDRSALARNAIYALAALLAFVGFIGLAIGPSALSPSDVMDILVAGPGTTTHALGDVIIVWHIRLPRVLMGAVVGASLAVAGATMQGLFRNPLADPGLVGVSSGAALGAIGVIVLGSGPLSPLLAVLGTYALPLAAFLGGLASTTLLYAIATRQGRTSVATMLLAGIALGAFAAAISGFLIFRSDDAQLRDVTFWSLGGLGGATWEKLLVGGPIMLAVVVAAPLLARGLNALALGEAEAFYLGLRVERLKRIAIFFVAAATGAAVASAGVIGFVGIVVPHLLRLAIGADHGPLLPASALLGAILLVLADMAARTLVSPAELPIGIITAAIGAPFFLWMLLRRRGFFDL